MRDTPTPETPAELAAAVKRLHRMVDDLQCRVRDTSNRATVTAIHAAIDRLATLAASSTAPKPPRDPSRTRIDAQDVAELTAKIKADPEVGARLMREAGIWDENNQLLPQFGGPRKDKT